MDITTLYVGQGALAVVRHQREAIIVDAYLPSSDKERCDDIETGLRHSLHEHSVAGLVLTGFDADHSSPDGVNLILTKYKPSWVMYPQYDKETDTASEVYRIIDNYKRRDAYSRLLQVPVRADTINPQILNDLEGQFSFKLYSPHSSDMDNSNNSSIVLKIVTYGQDSFSYLVTGDTENNRWENINRTCGNDLQSDVLAAPHHGSATSAHEGAIRSISPNTVLISAGVANEYGHPDVQALQIYKRFAKHVHRTNVDQGKHLWTRIAGGVLDTMLY